MLTRAARFSSMERPLRPHAKFYAVCAFGYVIGSETGFGGAVGWPTMSRPNESWRDLTVSAEALGMRGDALDQVRLLIERLAPAPVCNDCINERLGLPERNAATFATHLLAGTARFERQKSKCALCGTTKMIIRQKA